MQKGINVWSFDPSLSMEQCMILAKDAGFEGIELALAAKGPLSLESTDDDAKAIRAMAEKVGIYINALATGLYWQYSLTSDRPDIREKAKAVARREMELGKLLGADVVMVCPGAVGVDFQPADVVPDAKEIEFFAGSEIIDYEVAYQRSQDALRELALDAERIGIRIGVENIWNKFLLSPLEMRDFIDGIGSPWVGVWLDVANMMMYGYPQHWIRILSHRIIKVHFKDFRCAVKTLDGFVDLLAGDVDWKAVKKALDDIGYDGWCNGEMCPTYKQYTDQMIYNCSAAMDCILERKRFSH
ncbi:MAG: sugar phosphate isomerase/epimerase [Clostridiales bacterium]|nr:sugar phosphate isomerase/epimerase [Clostridiales bacterium]